MKTGTFVHFRKRETGLIAKGNYEKAAVVLKLALDQVMYKHAQHSMHRLKDAVSDFVWLYSNEAADISDDRITMCSTILRKSVLASQINIVKI